MSINFAYYSQAHASSAAINATNKVDEEAAAEHVKKWTCAIDGMLSNTLDIGSRTPINNVPAFLTPEVLSGGFVSGNLSAGGPLLQFEHFLVNMLFNKGTLDAETISGVYKIENMLPKKVVFRELSRIIVARGQLSKASLAHKRSLLNRFFVTEYGFQVLCAIYAGRNYHVKYPEESALLTVAWLVRQGQHGRATRLIRSISPYFHLVRFYPRPANNPVRLDLRASVSNSGEVRDALKRMQASGPKNNALKVCVMKAVIEKFNPAYDALLSVLLATCTRIPDVNAKGAVGAKTMTADHLMLLPFQKIPNAVRNALQAAVERLKSIESSLQSLMAPRKHLMTASEKKKTIKRFNPNKTNSGFFYQLALDFLKSPDKVITDKRMLGFARTILIQLQTNSKTGLPNKWRPELNIDILLTDASAEYNSSVWTETLKEFRQSQQGHVRHKEPSYISAEWASLLLSRMKTACGEDDHSGAEDVKPILADASLDETVSNGFAIRVGETVPSQAVKLIRKLQLGSIEELIESGIVTSMETLADVSGSFLGAAQIIGLPPSKDLPKKGVYRLSPKQVKKKDGEDKEDDDYHTALQEAERWNEDNAFRSLFVSCLAAFRRRRSLLLLNYQSQTRISELPWASELEEERKKRLRDQKGEHTRSANVEILVKLIKTCVSRWPHIMIPNKMVSALDSLAKATKTGSWAAHEELDTTSEDYSMFEGSDDLHEEKNRLTVSLSQWIGLTPELAADIFMGGFMPKWAKHSQIAAQGGRRTVYDVYYRRKADEGLWGDAGKGSGQSEKPEEGAVLMAEECQDVAGALWRKTVTGKLPMYSVTWNGVMIEWSMILTTHNYAYLFAILDELGAGFSQDEVLEHTVHGYNQLSSILGSIMGAKKKSSETRRAMLQTTKNVAYGWRQIVFLVSLLDRKHTESFFMRTVSLDQAAQGDHLQRALVDLKWVWKSVDDPRTVKGRRPWKAFRGWCFNGSHPIWDEQWCDKVKAQMERKLAEEMEIDIGVSDG